MLRGEIHSHCYNTDVYHTRYNVTARAEMVLKWHSVITLVCDTRCDVTRLDVTT